MRPEPPQVLANVLTSLAAEPRRPGGRRALGTPIGVVSGLQPFCSIDLIVESAPFVVLDEVQVTLA
jgi:hypothetical protein